MKNKFKIMCKSFFLVSFVLAFYFPNVSLAAQDDSNYSISYLIDAVKPHSIDEISSRVFDQQFKQSDSNTLNFGLIERAVWLKVTIPHYSATQIMEINKGSISSIQVYSSRKNKQAITENNDELIPINNIGVTLQNQQIISDQIDYRAILLKLPSGSTSYIRLKSSAALLLNYSLSDEKSYFSQSAYDYLFIGLFLGFILAFVIYGFINYKTVKDKNYLYYIFLLLSLGFYFSATSGIWGQYVVGQQFSSVSVLIFTSLVIISSLAFTRNFFETQSNYLNVDFFIKVLAVITIVFLVMAIIFEASWVYRIMRYLEIGTPALILYFCINCFLQGRKEAFFLVIGWLLYFVSFILTALMYSGILPISVITSIATALGTSSVIICLSLALMEKFVVEYDSNFAASSQEGSKLAHIIDQLKSQVAIKEKDAKQQNSLLQEKDQEIEYAQKRIREQASHDSVTKLINYSSFLLQFQRFFHDATRYHYPVVTLLMGIDGFEELNNKYETSTVNEILKAVAKVVDHEARNTDLVARYGESEIVFIMTHSSIENALIKAEDLLSKISQIKIKDYNGLSTTVSIGVTVMGASERSSDHRFILDKVENALEKAQKEGGNCVRSFSYENRHLSN